MENTKIFSIDWSNRIKYENEREFDNSLFSDVYRKAEKYVRDIISENGRGKKSLEHEMYCNDENFNNIIPFLGERGMGKTSAMVSFALSLQESDKYESAGRKVRFYLLPRIDVGMMVKGENLLDIILAKMWTSFEVKMNHENGFDPLTENLKNSFTNVKKWYQIYVDSMKGVEKVTLTSTRELKELSKCLNLVDALKELIKNYLFYMRNDKSAENYMVITLDDLDVATENVYLIMEQIRLFLNLPNVIIFVSADIGRLFMHYTKFFAEMLLPNNLNILSTYEERGNPDQKEQIGRYVEGYLAKTFPHNRRIYLPEVSLLYENEYIIEDDSINQDNEKNIKKLEYKIIQDKTGILWYPFGRKQDVLYNESLRKIVNDLNELKDISQLGTDSAQTLLDWLIRKIEEYARNKTDYNLQKFVSEINGADCFYLGNILLDYAKDNVYGLSDITFRSREGYGKVLADIYDIYKYLEDGLNEKCRIVLLYFSILTSKKLLKNSGESFDKFYRGTMFSYILKNPNNVKIILRAPSENDDEADDQRANDVINPNDLRIDFELKQYKAEDICEEIKAQSETIYKSMMLTMLCCNNVDNLETIWKYEEKADYQEKLDSRSKREEKDEIFNGQKEKSGFSVIKEQNELSASIDYLLNNICNYEEFVQKFIKGLVHALESSTNLGDAENENIREKVSKYPCFRLDSYKKWKKKYQIKNMADFMPLRSAEIMFRIAEKISRFTMPEVTKTESHLSELTEQRIWLQMGIIVQELKNIDEYYGFKDEKRNSAKVQEAIDLFN